MSLWSMFASEFLGTALLVTLGAGVIANNLLSKSKGRGGGWLMINFGWGFAIFVGVYAAWKTGGHLNPAVTLSKAVMHAYDPAVTLNGVEGAGEIPVSFGNVSMYILAQFVGAFVGAVFAWLAYKQQFDLPADPGTKLGVFATGPEIRSNVWNVVTEAIGTFVLVAFIAVSGGTPTAVGPLAVALVFVGIGASLGGPTGFALNPARDLGPRIAHAVLPIPDKGSSNWSYAWVPIVGPIIGGIVAVVVVYSLGLGSLDFSILGG